MVRVAIVYATDRGNTQKMAESVATGVQTVADAEALLMLADTATEDEIVACDALIIGSPGSYELSRLARQEVYRSGLRSIVDDGSHGGKSRSSVCFRWWLW